RTMSQCLRKTLPRCRTRLLRNPGHTYRWDARCHFRPAGKWIPLEAPPGCVSPWNVTSTIVTLHASGPPKSRTTSTTRRPGRISVLPRPKTGGTWTWYFHEEDAFHIDR